MEDIGDQAAIFKISLGLNCALKNYSIPQEEEKSLLNE